MESNKPRKVLLFRTMLIIAKAKEDSRLQFKSYIHVNIFNSFWSFDFRTDLYVILCIFVLLAK